MLFGLVQPDGFMVASSTTDSTSPSFTVGITCEGVVGLSILSSFVEFGDVVLLAGPQRVILSVALTYLIAEVDADNPRRVSALCLRPCP